VAVSSGAKRGKIEQATYDLNITRWNMQMEFTAELGAMVIQEGMEGRCTHFFVIVAGS